MSRTAAAESAGAKSQMVSIIAAVAILITAVALTGLFYNLPEATLAAIVIHAVWKNINFHKIRQYRAITQLDFATALVAMLGVLTLGLLEGLLLATMLGLIVLLLGTKQRSTYVLGKVPGTPIYRSLAHYPKAQTTPGLLILRYDGTLFFANAHNFIVAANRAIAAQDPLPRVVLLDAESMNDIDATAVITLVEFQEKLAQDHIQLRLARVKADVLAVMERGGLSKVLPPEHIYPSVQTGVDAFLAEQLSGNNGV
jgi:MFS superfamily sulfate permease-like transporter